MAQTRMCGSRRDPLRGARDRRRAAQTRMAFRRVLAGARQRFATAYVAAGACAESRCGAGVGRDGRAESCSSLSESHEREITLGNNWILFIGNGNNKKVYPGLVTLNENGADIILGSRSLASDDEGRSPEIHDNHFHIRRHILTKEDFSKVLSNCDIDSPGIHLGLWDGTSISESLTFLQQTFE